MSDPDKNVPWNEMINIRAVARTADGNPEIGMLELQIYPLPFTCLEEFSAHLREVAFKWLTEKEISSGEMTQVSKTSGGLH